MGEILDTARISVALPKGYEATTFTILIPILIPSLTLWVREVVEREGISKAEARQRKGVDLVEKVGMSILIENVSKRFGTFEALDHINLEIKTNSLVALVGGSGSGKSTLLRIIAGLEKPTEGRIWLAGQDSVSLSIQEREIGFVFQNYALFAHMTVSENIGFGLTLRNIPALESRLVSNNFASDTAGRVCQKLPCSIVWGQRQRVALARARDGTKGSPVR
jgi:ABC-type lipoprotein export system ATPase subunit